MLLLDLVNLCVRASLRLLKLISESLKLAPKPLSVDSSELALALILLPEFMERGLRFLCALL